MTPGSDTTSTQRRVLIATVGSTGDVTPLVGLGTRLRDEGYRVTIATYAMFADHVHEHGLHHHRLPGDPRTLDRSEEGIAWQEGGGGVTSTVRYLRIVADHLRDLNDALLAAARTENPDALLVSGMLALGGYDIGQALDIPSAGLHLQPMEPTGDHPPGGLPPLGRPGNRAAWSALMSAGTSTLAGPLRHLRDELGTSTKTLRAARREQRSQHWPILHGYSPHVLPRASDWRPGIGVTGYWWPPQRPDRRENPELDDFLDSGPPPVYVGFGSRSFRDTERLTELITTALRRAGTRGIIQSGWAGLAPTSDDILRIDETPHEWLFPRTAAIVHHAGAGTTGAGLRAGTPTVTIPVIADQPLWAARLNALGASPGSVPYPHLTADRLATLIREAIDNPTYRRRAQQLAHRIRTEDGARPVLHTLRRLTS